MLLLTACSDSGSSSSGSGKDVYDDFRIELYQTTQPCSSCGIWFVKTELEVETNTRTSKYVDNTGFVVKKSPYRVGYFRANTNSISKDRSITKATVYLTLHPHEGIANSDNSSVITVYGYIDGKKTYLREIRAGRDIKDKGYSKYGNPRVAVDFTEYMKKL